MTSTNRPPAASAPSLFRSGLTFRLVLASGLAGPLWLGIAWALRA